MSYDSILIDKKESIGFLTLNRPDDDNRLTSRMCTEVTQALKEFSKDSDIRVVIIRGSGKNFCLGKSITELENKRTAWNRLEVTDSYSHLMKSLVDFTKGLVIAVQGICVKGGAEIAMRGDITVMEEDAKIGFDAINLGLSCLVALAYLRSVVGQKRALELVLTGRLLSAREAERFGLINKIASKGKLDEVALQFAQMISEKRPLAVKLTKMANTQIRDMGPGMAQAFLNAQAAILGTAEGE